MLVSMISSGALQTVPAECPGCKMLQLESSEDVWEANATCIHFYSQKMHSPSLCTYSSPASFKSTFAQILCHRFAIDGH